MQDPQCHHGDHPRRCGENFSILYLPYAVPGSPPQVRGKHRHSLPRKAEHKDHPRRCGENLIIPPFPILSTGSPPQVRGKQPPSAKSIDKHRITPAGAGKTVFRFCDRLVFQDHPRRCGENFHPLHSELATLGSPPQVRGKLLVYVPIVLLRGITPAGAGKTRLQQEPPLFSRDHPRRCGENGTVLTGQLFRRGSPPQVRGKRLSP